MLLVPKENEIHFKQRQVYSGKIAAEPIMRKLLKEYLGNRVDPNHLSRVSTDLSKLCRGLAFTMNHPPEDIKTSYCTAAEDNRKLSDGDRGTLLVCLSRLGDESSCRRVLAAMRSNIPLEVFEELREPILDSGRLSQFQGFLADAVLRTQNISDAAHAMDVFTGASKGANVQPEVASWCQSTMGTLLKSHHLEMKEEDVKTLVELSRRHGLDFFEQQYVHFLTKYQPFIRQVVIHKLSAQEPALLYPNQRVTAYHSH